MLIEGFLKSALRAPERVAIDAVSGKITYGALLNRVRDLGGQLFRESKTDCPFVGILAPPGASAYTAILGTLYAGKAYLPLSPRFPLERNAQLIESSGCTTLVVGRECYSVLPAFLERLREPVTVLFVDRETIPSSLKALSRHRLISNSSGGSAMPPVRVADDALAYLLFTSGSTGVPKGVPVSQRSVETYLAGISTRVPLDPMDRVSQFFELTFDLSVHDLFATWEKGATLVPVPESEKFAAADFIRREKITYWFSVPMAANGLQRLRLLSPGAFPDLRQTLFCGERLAQSTVDAWRKAAPASSIHNLYGPTETTVAVLHYRCEMGDRDPWVPLGTPFSGQETMLLDETPKEVQGAGELCLAGSQVTPGYWNRPEESARAFVNFQGRRWYRTGDDVKKDASGFHFVGRRDRQVKIRGIRVELGEVETLLGRALGLSDVVVLYHKERASLYAFHNGAEGDEAEWIERSRKILPDYCLPDRFYVLKDLPLTVNGKIDYKALDRELEELLSNGD